MDSKKRPAVVIQNDRNNARLDNVIIVQMTTRLHPPNEPTRMVIDPQTPDGRLTGLWRVTAISCENLVTIEKRHIVRQLGVLTPALVQVLDQCLKASLALD